MESFIRMQAEIAKAISDVRAGKIQRVAFPGIGVAFNAENGRTVWKAQTT